jgi:hypothetical protein
VAAHNSTVGLKAPTMIVKIVPKAVYDMYRVAAINPEQFQSFPVALKNYFFIDSFAPNQLSCMLKHK